MMHPLCSNEQIHRIIASPLAPNHPVFSFTASQFARAINSCLPKAKNRSLDELTLSYFTDVFPSVIPSPCNVFNLAFATNQYPSNWKEASIIPLSKIPSLQFTSYTRPIANLPHFDKIIAQQFHQGFASTSARKVRS